MKQNYSKKIATCLRIAGWLCLLPASVWLYLFQLNQGMPGRYLFLGFLIFIILFALFVLVTANSKRWRNPAKTLMLAIFAVIFVSVIISIPIFIAYGNAKKINKV